jgi:hypothetical protein
VVDVTGGAEDDRFHWFMSLRSEPLMILVSLSLFCSFRSAARRVDGLAAFTSVASLQTADQLSRAIRAAPDAAPLAAWPGSRRVNS